MLLNEDAPARVIPAKPLVQERKVVSIADLAGHLRTVAYNPGGKLSNKLADAQSFRRKLRNTGHGSYRETNEDEQIELEELRRLNYPS